MDTLALLDPVPGDQPAGPDLEYDPDFLALEQAARGKPEQAVGDSVIAAEEADWGNVLEGAQPLLARSKDIRVAVLLTRALTRTANLAGLASGLGLIHGICERFWDNCHPLLDADDDNDPTMRLNALAPLTDSETLLRDVRASLVVRGAGQARVTVRDLLAAVGKAPVGGEAGPSQASIEAMIRDAASANPASVEAPRQALQACMALHRLLIDKVGAERAPDLRPLTDMLKAVAQSCDSALGVVTQGEGSDAADQSSAAANRGGNGLRSRADAIRALDEVCAYLERTEPAHPAPLFIRRAQRLLTKNFVEIMEELAPDSLGTIRQQTGLNQE